MGLRLGLLVVTLHPRARPCKGWEEAVYKAVLELKVSLGFGLVV